MERPTLLGHLAQFSSLYSQAELLCTQGLAYLLGTHENARSAIADEVEARTKARIGDRLTWHAEARQDDNSMRGVRAAESVAARGDSAEQDGAGNRCGRAVERLDQRAELLTVRRCGAHLTRGRGRPL